MSSAITAPFEQGIPPLEPGDRLTRAEFERRYEAMPAVKKAELIEGVVYMPSPVRLSRHALPDADLNFWLNFYRVHTPGVLSAANCTVRLDHDNEPQPDGLMFIDPAKGGQARLSADDYLEGAPELVAEVATSSVSFDLGTKKDVYRRSGVREYLVWRVRDGAFDWFELCEGLFVLRQPDEGRVQKSSVFPGLWLNVPALLRQDYPAVLATLEAGLASPEHAAFVRQLNPAG